MCASEWQKTDAPATVIESTYIGFTPTRCTYKLNTDACAYQVGCCLLQEQENKTWHPIGYFSRSLTDAERNYSASERECLAVVWCVFMLRPYLLGTQFTVRTDHHAPRWLLNLTDVSGRLARWRLRLAD